MDIATMKAIVSKLESLGDGELFIQDSTTLNGSVQVVVRQLVAVFYPASANEPLKGAREGQAIFIRGLVSIARSHLEWLGV